MNKFKYIPKYNRNMFQKMQFGYGLGSKKKKRVTPTRSEKNEIGDKQSWRCYECDNPISPTIAEYHHKDNNPSNWKLSNIVLICANCHKIKTNKQRIKKVQQIRIERENRDKTPFGFDINKEINASSISGKRKKPKESGLFDIPKEIKEIKELSLFNGKNMFGNSKPKKTKTPSLFGGVDMFSTQKKSKKAKRLLGF